jgi:CubicO group peptidase (beta-lactamase class C family)
VETPEPLIESTFEPVEEPSAGVRRSGPSLWGLGEQATWVSGLVLALSALTGWYSGTGEGVPVSVVGWHTGLLGKLVLVIGVAAIVVVVLRQWGFDLPAAVPESLIVIALGALATICVLVRAISIPDEFFFAHRGIGLWISLVAALGLIGAGLLQASEEL